LSLFVVQVAIFEEDICPSCYAGKLVSSDNNLTKTCQINGCKMVYKIIDSGLYGLG
jgi:uncharacterized protein (DUF983 family)